MSNFKDEALYSQKDYDNLSEDIDGEENAALPWNSLHLRELGITATTFFIFPRRQL